MTDPEKITVYLTDESGEEYESVLPVRFEVCDNCQGKGTHVNRAIDGNGLSPELAEDPEFMEGYMSGVYDVSCDECKGKRVVALPDESRCSPEQLQAYNEECQARYEVEAESRAEMRAMYGPEY